MGGIVGSVAGPAGIAAGISIGIGTGANIGGGLSLSVDPQKVIERIELENVHGCCVDVDGETYPVGWLPWIADLKSWRTYDPTTIDGVGVLLRAETIFGPNSASCKGKDP